MPIYEYQCKKCEHQFETMQKISEGPLKKCPECGKLALSKLISAAGFRLKGGGWYETDFKSGNKKNLAAGDKAGSGDSSGSADSSGGADGGSSSSSDSGSATASSKDSSNKSSSKSSSGTSKTAKKGGKSKKSTAD